MINFTYSQLINVGAYLGYGKKNLFFLSTWMVFSIYKNICLLDLNYSFLFIKLSFSVLRSTVLFKQPIWFINLDQTKADYVKSGALLCGEFFCNQFWIRGMVSNYLVVFAIFRKFLTTPFFMRSKRSIKKIENLALNWFLTRFTWPRLAFISGLSSNLSAILEFCITGIPCITITDTRFLTTNVLFPIPGNEQSLLSSQFYNQFIGHVILRLKFINIMNWFLNIRNSKRLISFSEWLQIKIEQKKYDYKKDLFYNHIFSYRYLLYKGLGFSFYGMENLSKLLNKFNFSNYKYKSSLDLIFISKKFLNSNILYQGFGLACQTKVWLRFSNFGFNIKNFKRNRFICRLVSKMRIGGLQFLINKLKIENLINSGCFIFIVQAIFINYFLTFFPSSIFHNYKVNFKNKLYLFRSIILHGLLPCLFVNLNTFVIKFNIKSFVSLPKINVIKNKYIKRTLSLLSVQSKMVKGSFLNLNLWNMHILKRNKFWFVWPVPNILFWYFVSYFDYFKLSKVNFLNINNNMIFFNWNFVYINSWFSKNKISIKKFGSKFKIRLAIKKNK